MCIYKYYINLLLVSEINKNPSSDAWKLLGTATCSSDSPPESPPGVSCFRVSRWRWTSPCHETWDRFRGQIWGLESQISSNWSEIVYISWISKQIQISRVLCSQATLLDVFQSNNLLLVAMIVRKKTNFFKLTPCDSRKWRSPLYAAPPCDSEKWMFIGIPYQKWKTPGGRPSWWSQSMVCIVNEKHLGVLHHSYSANTFGNHFVMASM